MSDTSQLSISFSNSSDDSTSYWVNIEQVEFESDTVSLDEAAELIDQAFELDSCSEEETTAEEEVDVEEEAVEESDFDILVFESMNIASCYVAGDGKFEAKVKIYRSHQDIDYKLVVENGEVLTTVSVEEEVSEEVEVNGSSFTLDKPIQSISSLGISYSSIDGGTVKLGASYEGTVSITYLTVYDLVTINVQGNPTTYETEDGCRCLVFYNSLVDEVVIEAPDEDDSDSAFDMEMYCNVNVVSNIPADNVSCYEIHNMTTNCICSQSEISRVTKEVSVNCPDEYHCPGTETSCRKLIGSKTYQVSAQYCEGEETRINDPDYYEEVCCNPTIRSLLPDCQTQHKLYRGGKSINGGKEKYKSLYGENTVFVAVGPSTGCCGDWTIRYEVITRNCCEDAETLEWDFDFSADYVSAGSSAKVGIDGGGSSNAVTWSIVGDGFYLDVARNLKTVSTEGNKVEIYTDEDACGVATIFASDTCSSVKGFIQSTLGHWEQIPESEWPHSGAINYTDVGKDEDNAYYLEGEKEGYLVRQIIVKKYVDSSQYRSTSEYHCELIPESAQEVQASLVDRYGTGLEEKVSVQSVMASQEDANYIGLIQENTSHGLTLDMWYACGFQGACSTCFTYYKSTNPRATAAWLATYIKLGTAIFYKWVC